MSIDAVWGPSSGDELEAAGAMSAFDAVEQRSRDDSLAEFLEAEPTLLGEPLMVVGTSVLTKDGDVVDVLALDEHGVTQVISVGHGIASVETIGNVIGQGAWVDELDGTAIRSIYDAHHADETFDESFHRHFGEHAPAELNGAQVLTVVAAGLDDAAERGARYLADQDIEFRAFAYQEFVDADDTYVMTSRLV